MKLFLKILLSIILIIVAILGIVYYLTTGMVQSVDNFFAQVKNNNIEQAYQDLSGAFKANTTVEDLKSFLEASQLKNFKSASWGSRSFHNADGQVQGTITTTDEIVIPLRVNLVKEAGEWKILGLFLSETGLENNNTSKPLLLPNKEEVNSLVAETTNVLTQALDSRDMTNLHAYISSLWREQYTVEQLDQAYQPLYKVEANWENISKLQAIIEDEPKYADDTGLVINGYYDTRPDRLIFTYRYVQENSTWKPLGIRINFVSMAEENLVE